MSDNGKKTITNLLEDRQFGLLAELIARKRGHLRYLNRLLYETGGLLRWRAVEGMGEVAQRLAAEDPEYVRNIIRNLLWTINDESGGIGWSAPECIGEIIYRCPDMFGEFASIVLSFIDEKMLRRGVLWAAGRIALARPGLIREEVPDLTRFLDDPDPAVRGYTLRLFEIIGKKPDFERYSHLLEDRSTVPVYENGFLKEVTVAGLAAGLFRATGDAPGSV